MHQQKLAQRDDDNWKKSNSVKPSYVRPTVELIRVDMDTHSKTNVSPKEKSLHGPS
jgi:hypothetical protein